ncbi:hypothetical protein PSTT_11962, partial [Puccinia striiformis]
TEARQDELRETFSEELMRMNGRLAPVFLAHQKDLSGEGVVENPTTEDLLSSDHSRSMLIETEIEHAVLNSESILQSLLNASRNQVSIETLNLTRFDPNHGHQTQFRQRCIYHCSITSRASPFTTHSSNLDP